jgi:predicted membrane-bound spermidine synthase
MACSTPKALESKSMRAVRLGLYSVFFASGAAALIYQVGWQRVLSLHAGMDLFSVTTVVAAFMAGLGMGNLLGGAIADRLTPRRAILVYASAELLIGAFGWFSIWLLYDQYGSFSSYIRSNTSAFLFHFILLSIPTTLMGTTLPLLSRGVVRRNLEIAPMVGKLYGANTLGAAVGSIATADWWILGRVGLTVTVQIAACLSLASGLLALQIMRATDGAAAEPVESSPLTTPQTALFGKPTHWIIVYGLTGFVALGLEVVWFRLLNVLMDSTTYTFSRLLALYLVFLGFGVMAGSRLSPKIQRPGQLFLWLQFAIGFVALLGPLLVVKYMEAYGQFYSEAYQRLFRNIAAPLLVLPVPTFLMGFCFPLIQRLVAQTTATLGKRTGTLLFSNTVGAFLGTVLTGFLFLDVLGTPITLLMLSLSLMLLGLYVAHASQRGTRRLVAELLVLSVAALSAASFPTGRSFWGPLHGTDPTKVTLLEDGTCVTSFVQHEANWLYHLKISGQGQGGIPFDDFHVRLGAVPALLHPNPKDVLVIGLGVGATLYGVSLDRRIGSIDCVEICAGEIGLLKGLRGRNVSEIDQLFSDPRIRITVQDGRKFLLDTMSRFDLIVSDTLLPRSAYSGSLYSLEFYELVRRRLKPGGLFAQWVATTRTLQTASYVFPYVYVLPHKVFPLRTDSGQDIFVASELPIAVNPTILTERYIHVNREHLQPDVEQRLVTYLKTASGDNGFQKSRIDLKTLNRDLFPRDEYTHW